jgi:hypothetical protein
MLPRDGDLSVDFLELCERSAFLRFDRFVSDAQSPETQTKTTVNKRFSALTHPNFFSDENSCFSTPHPKNF